MKVLFLTMTNLKSLQGRSLYVDLLNYFKKQGHDVFVVSPNERRFKEKTVLRKEKGASILNVKTLNLKKTSAIEKGVGQLLVEYQYLNAIKKYFNDIKFDLILYSTPPITFYKVINYIKKRDNAYAYLLLKDIFPQNAVDMKMLKKNGLLHRFFLKKEIELYHISDGIGCMSEANKEYVLKHNSSISAEKVEVNPNTILPQLLSYKEVDSQLTRKKYGLPIGKKIFLYAGNIGVPQGIEFLLETISNSNDENAFFLVVGAGTQYSKVASWFDINKPENAKLFTRLEKSDYDALAAACDVGMIFLHKDFTIPNFPSRLLSYLEMSMPVLAATDRNTDIGKVISNANCGFWVESGNIDGMLNGINRICSDGDLYQRMKLNSMKLLMENYTVDKSYNSIANRLQIKTI